MQGGGGEGYYKKRTGSFFALDNKAKTKCEAIGMAVLYQKKNTMEAGRMSAYFHSVDITTISTYAIYHWAKTHCDPAYTIPVYTT